MTIDFFCFDMGNVLLSFDYDVAARQMSQICGAPPEKCRQVAFDESELLRDFETGRITAAEFHDRFSHITGTTSDRDALLHAHSDMFSIKPDTVRVLTQLKGVRRRTGLMSNTCSDHFEFCRERFGAIRDLFDVYVLSYEVGAMKPDRKIYDVAIEKAGVPAERIFYVDDREENIAGAREAGMDAVLFTGASRLIDDLRGRGVEMNL